MEPAEECKELGLHSWQLSAFNKRTFSLHLSRSFRLCPTDKYLKAEPRPIRFSPPKEAGLQPNSPKAVHVHVHVNVYVNVDVHVDVDGLSNPIYKVRSRDISASHFYVSCGFRLKPRPHSLLSIRIPFRYNGAIRLIRNFMH